MIKILWLSPAFNHYKARFLNHLAEHPSIDLTILTGSGRENEGDKEVEDDWNFKLLKTAVAKASFGKSKEISSNLKIHAKDYDWILIPAEKKNLPLFLYLLFLKFRLNRLKLISYNHPFLKSKGGVTTNLDKWLTKFFYRKLDRVVFYTEISCQLAIKGGFIKPEKAYWANNTLDNTEIEKHYNYSPPSTNNFTILFIGRLIKSKRIDVLLEYYKILKEQNPTKQLRLEIIGDGPEAYRLKNRDLEVDNIIWHGTVVDEEKIAPIMTRSNIVFIPGLSGLSINHALFYGRPYITMESTNHGPEIDYLKSGKHGFILSGDEKNHLSQIQSLVDKPELLEKMARNAYESGKDLTVQNWVSQMVKSIQHD